MKVKAKELRIGNLIYFQAEPYVPEFSELEVFKLSKNRVNGKHQSCFKVIPLTEDWLLKLGFENFEGIGMLKNGLYIDGTVAHFSFDYWRLGSDAQYRDFDDFSEIPKEIKYVHELQNLYFILTKKELILNTQSNETSKTQKENIGV